MTVNREQSEIFYASGPDVVEAIRSILEGEQVDYSYEKTIEAPDHGRFDTVIKPAAWPLLLTTKMVISICAGGSETEVIVQTRSQWFILGDIFDFYGGYIRHMLDAIRHRIPSGRLGITAIKTGAPPSGAMSTQFASVVESLGYRIKCSRNSFEVILPLWCGVTGSIRKGQLYIEPRFGLFHRTTATILHLFVLPLMLLFLCVPIIFVVQLAGIDVVVAGSSAFAVCSLLMVTVYVRNVYRYILTENAMIIMRQVYHAEYLMPPANGADTRMAVKTSFRENGGTLRSSEYRE